MSLAMQANIPHRLLYTTLTCIVLVCIFAFIGTDNLADVPIDYNDELNVKVKDKVPVELFVMSKCPDAVFCEAVFSNVISEIGEIVDLDINFIGNTNSTQKYGVTCKHGDSECLGNIQELCASRLSPKRWYSFVLCMNKSYKSIGLDDKLTNQCLKFSGINKRDFKNCVEKDGPKLLQRNVRRGENLSINKSCTILINRGEYKCIHDGEWKECPDGHEIGDFARQICKSYPGKDITPRCNKYL